MGAGGAGPLPRGVVPLRVADPTARPTQDLEVHPMNRAFLRWFYVAVQFIMLAVSIPKVATLFHAYDPQVMGPTIAGIDSRNWLVGIAIDLTATITTWAAMAKCEATGK